MRRLEYLCYQHGYIMHDLVGTSVASKHVTERKQLVIDLGLSDDEFNQIVYNQQEKRRTNSPQYSIFTRRNPTMNRRDNKEMRVGSGGRNRNSIRFPSKKRKHAWKNFYKLFPKLKPIVGEIMEVPANTEFFSAALDKKHKVHYPFKIKVTECGCGYYSEISGIIIEDKNKPYIFEDKNYGEITIQEYYIHIKR